LGRLALYSVNPQISLERLTAIRAPRAELDLWSGTVRSQFTLDGDLVTVTTVAHPTEPIFAVRVESSALKRGLAVAWVLDPQPDPLTQFEEPLRDTTAWERSDPGRWLGRRTVENLK